MITLFKVLMAPDVGDDLAGVLASGHVAQGSRVDFFESGLAKELGLEPDQLLLVNSGTSALHLAYHLAGVGPGDEVIVSPMTCSATIVPILHHGAVPVWADVDPVTGLIDPMSVQSKLTDRTRAVVGIDWAGTPASYSALRVVVPREIPLIEDAAHAMLAERDGRQIGTYAYEENLYVCWSLQAIKHLTSGDGGALVCPSEDLTDRGRLLRWFGFDRRSSANFRCAQNLAEAGYKFHMNDIAAAIGLANLQHVRAAVARHRANAARYHAALSDLAPRVVVTPLAAGSSWWIYPLLVADRDGFIEHMRQAGIEAGQVHRRNDEHSAFIRVAGAVEPGSLPGLDRFAGHQVAIPVGWWLSQDDVTRVIDAVRAWAAIPVAEVA